MTYNDFNRKKDLFDDYYLQLTMWASAYLSSMHVGLIASSKEHHRLPADTYEYLNNSLNEMLCILRERIEAASDVPDQSTVPAQQLVTRVRTGRRGRPRLEINQQYLQLSMDHEPTTEIAPVVGASTRTIARRAVEYGIRQPGTPVAIRTVDANGSPQVAYPGRTARRTLSNEAMDALMQEALTIFPSFGRQMLDGFFKARGHKVTRTQISASFQRVNGTGPEFGQPRIQRRVYKVAGPNSLWHHDGHHSVYSNIPENRRTDSG
jgi:hypothetical protein